MQTLSAMQKSSIVADLPPISDTDEDCEACMEGEQHRQPFPQESSTRAEAPLQLVHADLCGKMNTQALGGSSYYFALIDDYSRKTWMYFLKGKTQAFGKFKGMSSDGGSRNWEEAEEASN
jgi:hypothetical protein